MNELHHIPSETEPVPVEMAHACFMVSSSTLRAFELSLGTNKTPFSMDYFISVYESMFFNEHKPLL